MTGVDNLQDVIRCNLCENPNPEHYCVSCEINFCETCAGKHLSGEFKVHTVMPNKQRRSAYYPTCPKHSTKQCELHCAKCDIPICTRCISSEHSEHKAKDIMIFFESKQKTLQTDIQELEKFLTHDYQEMAKSTKFQKDKVNKEFEISLDSISKLEKDWHREIDTIIQREKNNVERMKTKCMHALDNQEGEINKQISQIRRHMSDLKKLLENNDVYMISSYKSMNAKFRRFPPEVSIKIPTFRYQKIDTEGLRKQFGSLPECSIKRREKTSLKMKF